MPRLRYIEESEKIPHTREMIESNARAHLIHAWSA
jgi:hypothetical protein